jgi:hypothetical protein
MQRQLKKAFVNKFFRIRGFSILVITTIVFGVSISAKAQTSAEESFRARYKPQYPPAAQAKPKSEDLRVVNGKLYNIKLSNLWKERTFEFVRRKDNLVFANEITFKDIYKQQWFEGDVVSDQQRAGLDSPPPGNVLQSRGWRNVKVGRDRIVGERVAITNLTRTDLAVGKDFTIATMIVDKSETNRLVLHDVGAIYVPSKTNAFAPTKP